MSSPNTDYQPPDIRLADWHNSADKHALCGIRRRVFIEEQSVPEALEWDDDDDTAQHCIVLLHNNAVATARLLPSGQLGRMAVLPEYRHQSIGSALMRYVLRLAPTLDFSSLFLHAQLHAIPFYQRFGFVTEGDEFMDAGIPHRAMRLLLPPDRRHAGGVAQASAAIPLANIHDCRQAALNLINNAKRSLCILSQDLESDLYSTAECYDAVAKLARRSRYSTVRIIIRNKKPIIEHGHRLLTLSQQLSTTIDIRVLSVSASEQKSCYLITDDNGLLLRKNPEVWSGLAWENYRSYVHNRLEEFTELWNIAECDPDLRQLRI